MALKDYAFYVDFGDGSTTGYYGLTQWATGTAKAAGAIVRQKTTPTAGNERVFVCIVAGTTHATTEPTWVVTRGAKTTDNTVTWMEASGLAGLNGDSTNTPTWTAFRAVSTSPSLGQLIKRDNGASYWICTTAGTVGGSEPAWSADTAGTTQADNTATWTCLGVVGNWAAWATPSPKIWDVCQTSWATSGTTVYVSDRHAETSSAALTITFRGAAGAPQNIICADHTAAVPPAASTTGASVTVTANAVLTVGSTGLHNYIEGISFVGGSGGTSSGIAVCGGGDGRNYFKNCAFTLRGASTCALTVGTANGSDIVFDNCTVTFGNAAGMNITLGSNFHWKNTSSQFSWTTQPTTLFNFLGSGPVSAILEGLDLSNVTNTLVGSAPSSVAGGLGFVLKDCKLNASATIATRQSSVWNSPIDLVRSHDSVGYNLQRVDYAGDLTTETTVVRTGGATDGTTPISWKIVTTANSLWHSPFECPPIRIWNNTVAGNVTVTLYGIWGGGAVPTNADIWSELVYMGSSTSPLGTWATNGTTDFLATGSAQGSDTSSWGGSTTAFKLTHTFAPRKAGYIYLYVKAAKVSSTFYIDPKPALS